MSRFPYPIPQAVKTKRRCMFRMPGRAYDCRAVGKYELDGRGYCASHYDTAWKVANPEYGQQHDWHFHVNRFTGEMDRYETCCRCSAVKVHDGLPQCPCRGRQAEIVLW